MMKLVLLAALIGLSLAAPGAAPAKNVPAKKAGSRVFVCYYGSWAVYRPGAGKYDVEQIDPNLCTHIVFGFAGLHKSEYTIYSLDPWNELDDNWGKGAFKRFCKLKEQNPELKAILAIGGWNEKSKQYSEMAESAAHRKTFIDSVIAFLPKFGFDGLDLDWEYPTLRGGGPNDKENFAILIKEMVPAMKAAGLIVTAAVGAGFDKIDVAYDVPVMSEHLEYISVMTYDFFGCWDKWTQHNAPLYAHPDTQENVTNYNTEFGIKYWIEKGASPQKLTIGLPLYGRGFKLENPEVKGVHAPAADCGIAGPYTRQKGILGWNEICDKQRAGGWDIVFDEYLQAPYGTFSSYSGTKDQWYSFDDTESLRFKVQLANKYNLLGGMVWSVETDDFQGSCGDGVNPLMLAIKDELNGGSPNPPTPGPIKTTTSTTRDPTAPTEATTTTKPHTTVQPDEKCKHEGINDHEDPKDCIHFYICTVKADGTWDAQLEECGAGTVFNPSISGCDFPANVPGCEDYPHQE